MQTEGNCVKTANVCADKATVDLICGVLQSDGVPLRRSPCNG